MDSKKLQLIQSAARLCSLGEEMEVAREKLRTLVAAGVPYESAEMKDALLAFQMLEARWKQQESEHLALKQEIENR